MHARLVYNLQQAIIIMDVKSRTEYMKDLYVATNVTAKMSHVTQQCGHEGYGYYRYCRALVTKVTRLALLINDTMYRLDVYDVYVYRLD